MARARNIKPGFFRNADLVELPIETRLFFIGLWTIADRAGRLEDRPKQIKMELFPADSFDCDAMLNELASIGMVERYEYEGKRYLNIVNFCKHQNPHKEEKASTIPDSCGNIAEHKQARCKHGANTVQPKCENHGNPADSLIPDSPIPESSEQPLPEAAPPVADNPEKSETELQAVCRQTWDAYSEAYERKYSTKPVRNAKVSSQVKQFVQRIGYDESLSVAEWFVSHPGDFYVKDLHGFGLLLKDAEKLRTQWATGRVSTQAAKNTPAPENFGAKNYGTGGKL